MVKMMSSQTLSDFLVFRDVSWLVYWVMLWLGYSPSTYLSKQKNLCVYIIDKKEDRPDCNWLIQVVSSAKKNLLRLGSLLPLCLLSDYPPKKIIFLLTKKRDKRWSDHNCLIPCFYPVGQKNCVFSSCLFVFFAHHRPNTRLCWMPAPAEDLNFSNFLPCAGLLLSAAI